MIIRKIASNILAILRMDDIKISEFEERHGVSRGYLSRKANNGGTFDLNVVISMADELHVCIDELRRIDFVKISEREILTRKIEKLQFELKALEGEEVVNE